MIKASKLFSWILACLLFGGAVIFSSALQSCEKSGNSGQEGQVKAGDAILHTDSSPEDLALIDRGLDIVGPSQQTLGGKLKAALEAGGVRHAAEYCSTAAFPLIDSLSIAFGASIRRTSLKARNPMDAPTPEERAVLEAYTAKFHAGQGMDPLISTLADGKKAFYSPIIVQEMCLKCHGAIGTDIAQADYEHIQGIYPDDPATGYKIGDLRGMWSLTFNE